MIRILRPQSVKVAFKWLDQWPMVRRGVAIPTAHAAGRVLAEDVVATGAIPADDLCARDGFAVQAAATVGSSDYSPLPFQQQSGGDTLLPGSAMPVKQGQALPEGADAVLALDQVHAQGRFLEVMESLAVGDGVAAAGEECAAGQVLLPRNRRLRPQDLARLAQADMAQAHVLAQPRIAMVFSDSLVEQLCSAMVSAMVHRDGGRMIEPVSDLNGLLDCDADLLLMVGGSGHDESADFYQAMQENKAIEIDVDGVAINPGVGSVLAKMNKKPLFLLPGTPLACFAAFDLLVSRLLRRMSGYHNGSAYVSVEMPLGRKIASRIGRMEMARVKCEAGLARPLAVAESRILATSVEADGFVLVPENSEGHAQGETVRVFLYPESFSDQ